MTGLPAKALGARASIARVHHARRAGEQSSFPKEVFRLPGASRRGILAVQPHAGRGSTGQRWRLSVGAVDSTTNSTTKLTQSAGKHGRCPMIVADDVGDDNGGERLGGNTTRYLQKLKWYRRPTTQN